MSGGDPIAAYLQALARRLRPVPAALREEWMREIASHLHEAAAESEGDAEARARQAVARFGPVEDVANGLLAEALLERGSHGFRPLSLARGLAAAYGLGWTLSALAFSLGYLVLLVVAVATIGKLVNPQAGLWLHPHGGWALSLHGFEGSREVLGWWLPVIGTLLCVGGWWALNRLLRWALGRGRRQWRRALGSRLAGG